MLELGKNCFVCVFWGFFVKVSLVDGFFEAIFERFSYSWLLVVREQANY